MLVDRLFENLALTVEAFATCQVAPGWRLRLPALDWVTLHFVVKGVGAVRDAQSHVFPVGPDTMAVVPPHLSHAIECGPRVESETGVGGGPSSGDGIPLHLAGSPGDVEFIVACGRLRATYGVGLGLFDQLREVLILDFTDEPRVRSTFEALLQEQETPGPANQVMMSALMNACLIHMFRRLCRHPDYRLPWLAALEDERMARALEAVLAHPEHKHSVESLAALANSSRSAFAKRFHDSFGRTPMEYVRDVRLRKSAELLRRDGRLSVDAVASRVGFASRSQFSHAFRETFGCSPTEFREGGC